MRLIILNLKDFNCIERFRFIDSLPNLELRESNIQITDLNYIEMNLKQTKISLNVQILKYQI